MFFLYHLSLCRKSLISRTCRIYEQPPPPLKQDADEEGAPRARMVNSEYRTGLQAVFDGRSLLVIKYYSILYYSNSAADSVNAPSPVHRQHTDPTGLLVQCFKPSVPPRMVDLRVSKF